MRCRLPRSPPVSRRILEVPAHRPGFGVEGDAAIGEEVVARPQVGLEPRERVPRAPDRQLRRRVVDAGLLKGRAAEPPRVALGGPGLGAGLAGRGHRVGRPEVLAGPGVDRIDPAAGATVGAATADDDAIADDQRRRHDGVAVDADRRPAPPLELSGGHIDPVNRPVRRSRDDIVTIERDAAARFQPGVEVRWPASLSQTTHALVGHRACYLAPAVDDVDVPVLDERAQRQRRGVVAAALDQVAERDAVEDFSPPTFSRLIWDSPEYRLPS